MTILLLNDNTVVNKLVTLSAQKTSDTLEAIESIRDIKNTSYDLLIVDDTKYTNSTLKEIKEKISFTTSLFICSKNAKEDGGFTSILRKPFLPTSLVELFATIGKDIKANDELALDREELDLDDELTLDGEELDLDDELTLDGEDLDSDIENVEEGVLDKEEIQEVQDLIDEAELEVDDDIAEVENNDKKEPDISEEFELLDDLEDDEEVEKKEEESDIEDLELPNNLELDEEVKEDAEESDIEELELPDDLKQDEEISLEEAVSELTEEDLAQEIDEDMLVDIPDLNSISSDDLKLAIGEELTNAQEDKEEVVESKTSKELKYDTEITPNNDGVEALKKLLTALSNEDVVASLKGMKININITLGGNYE
jgi:uncharacterized membrane protein